MNVENPTNVSSWKLNVIKAVPTAVFFGMMVAHGHPIAGAVGAFFVWAFVAAFLVAVANQMNRVRAVLEARREDAEMLDRGVDPNLVATRRATITGARKAKAEAAKPKKEPRTDGPFTRWVQRIAWLSWLIIFVAGSNAYGSFNGFLLAAVLTWPVIVPVGIIRFYTKGTKSHYAMNDVNLRSARLREKEDIKIVRRVTGDRTEQHRLLRQIEEKRERELRDWGLKGGDQRSRRPRGQ